MPEKNDNLWAPWRMEYIHSLEGGPDEDGCFLCRYWNERDKDAENHVVWRTERAMVVMNRFPYTNGHLLISAAEHVPDLEGLDEASLMEMMRTTRDALRVLKETIRPHGFNVGINIARCAGAGLPDHIHVHVVPRWNGDTNYMAVIGDVRVVPQAIEALHQQLTASASKLRLSP